MLAYALHRLRSARRCDEKSLASPPPGGSVRRSKVAWSVGSNPTTCGLLREVADGTPNARGTIPKGLVNEGPPAIFVEASLAYATTFGTSFVPPSTITENTWFRPRGKMEFTLTGGGLASPRSNTCPGVA